MAVDPDASPPSLLVWMDLEMTGLDPDVDTIIEMATLITDAELKIVARGPELVINQPAERFAKMDNWNQEHHTKSGLWDSVLKSEISLAQAEKQTVDFIKKHVAHKTAPLCGNSIWQDRRFIAKHMHKLDDYLHYRLVDVSTVKELAKRWYPDLGPYSKKAISHRALDDIEESIEELRYYRDKLFLATSEVK